ncbi:MAG: flavodoxin-dependent (E)-4-hydroxy-3-methylbut-2-enyl-diphosphate synthase [Candidatus Marinimicrobia bacterium]|nr:flavodoxin-dependent (E)-4-hydroxy-3-methylbut-2-enyl-diphosphate synthase [Candidatus Neomarinimicrobiota bacterium]MDD5709778.1 flavodoxin-dependent (E)-4-hydroxy-3-methylbut-2-enyl-diphosphate synthase [Candidatus Neomarinimicrobiota bacterium]
MIRRRKTRSLSVADIFIGGDAPVSVQSMINTAPDAVSEALEQIARLEQAGCEIVRMAVPNRESVKSFAAIKKRIGIPLVADIHFDYRLALAALDAGADKIRINPGNIGSGERTRTVLRACEEKNVPIRIGVNSGSLEKPILERYGHPTPEALVESAASHIRICEEAGFTNIVVSIKSSDLMATIEANRLFSERYDYPLHLGITESGTIRSGSIRSAAGIGALLAEGIGDTIRVSLSGDPVQEIRVARTLLDALGLRRMGVRVISCPSCGRSTYDIAAVAEALEERVSGIDKDLTVAVMGCVVNGPGEAREADIGIAGAGPGQIMLFENGNKSAVLPLEGIVERLVEMIRKR